MTGWLMTLRRLLLPTAILALLCALCPTAWSAEDVLAKGDDPRLDSKVTLDAEGIALHAALEQLSQATNVTVVAGLNDDDWSVRDRKIIVHVKDMRLGDLMRQIGSTFHFHWSRGGDAGKYTYRLWQDKIELQEEESLRSAENTELTKQAREKRENGLADMVDLGSLSATDAANLKSSDPWRYVLATEPLGRDVADLLTSFPEARNAFVQGTQATFPVAELPPALQDTVRRIAESYDTLTKDIGATEDHSDLLNRFEKLQITINRRPRLSEGVIDQSMLGRITIGTGASSFDIPLFDPASPVGKALGKAIISLKGGTPKEEVGKQLQTDMTEAVKVITQTATSSNRDITSDPELREKVKLFTGSTTATLPVALKVLALKTGLNVISDYFPGGAPALDGLEKTIGQHLETIRELYGTNWTKSGNVVTFRDKEWFVKRAYAVPEVWMKYWTDRGKLNNGLLIDDMAQIGNLRDEQIDHTIMADPMMARLGAGEAARNRQILRFYSALTADQRKQMSGSGLSVGSLSDDVWNTLKTALATKGAAYAGVQKGSQIVQFTQSPPDAVELTYTFTFHPNDSDPAVTFKLTSGVVFTGFPEKPKDKDK